MAKHPVSSWSFDHFVCKNRLKTETTFAYWICAIKPKRKLPPLDELALGMNVYCDLEEQTDDPKHFPTLLEKSISFLRPLAPVTFAKKWTPYPVAAKSLGEPQRFDTSRDDTYCYAYAIWKPKWLGDLAISSKNPDETHFKYLLRLTSCRAEQMNCDIIIVGQIGWSYKDAKTEPMNIETSLAMLKYGYVYADRVPR